MSTAVILGSPSSQRALLEELFVSNLGCHVTILEDAAQLPACLTNMSPDLLMLGMPDGNLLWMDMVSLFRQHPALRPPVVLTYSAGLCGCSTVFADAALRCISRPDELWEHCLMELLLTLGFISSATGSQYLLCAMKLIARNPQELTLLTKSLYGQVAKLFHSTSSAVEKAMRKQVHNAFQRGNVAAWARLFPASCAQGHCPSLGLFLRTLYNDLYFGENAAGKGDRI